MILPTIDGAAIVASIKANQPATETVTREELAAIRRAMPFRDFWLAQQAVPLVGAPAHAVAIIGSTTIVLDPST